MSGRTRTSAGKCRSRKSTIVSKPPGDGAIEPGVFTQVPTSAIVARIVSTFETSPPPFDQRGDHHVNRVADAVKRLEGEPQCTMLGKHGHDFGMAGKRGYCDGCPIVRGARKHPPISGASRTLSASPVSAARSKILLAAS